MTSLFFAQQTVLAPFAIPLTELFATEHSPTFLIAFLSGFGYQEMFLFAVIALLLFGKRLPEVARNFGRTYKQLRGKVDEFQREFRDWDKEDTPSYQTPRFSPDNDDVNEDRVEPKAPKFLPPPPEDDG